jgi:hypothetical protein
MEALLVRQAHLGHESGGELIEEVEPSTGDRRSPMLKHDEQGEPGAVGIGGLFSALEPLQDWACGVLDARQEVLRPGIGRTVWVLKTVVVRQRRFVFRRNRPGLAADLVEPPQKALSLAGSLREAPKQASPAGSDGVCQPRVQTSRQRRRPRRPPQRCHPSAKVGLEILSQEDYERAVRRSGKCDP